MKRETKPSARESSNGEIPRAYSPEMSAWYVISAFGFYAVDPVSGNYVMGAPLFDRAEIELAGGKRLVIKARRSSPEDKYVSSVSFNGKPYDKVWFSHADIVDGAEIVFTMASKPNKEFGSSPGNAAPSFSS